MRLFPRIKLLLLAFGGVMIPVHSFATMPVIDYTAIIRMTEELNQLKKQYDLLNQTYRNAQQQLDQSKQLLKDGEGHYGFGSLDNSAADLKNREWSPDTWENALKGLSGGNPERYQELLNSYKQTHPTLSQAAFSKGSNAEQATLYQQQVDSNQAAAVNTNYAFNDINQHLEAVHQLSSQIESAQNDKAAMDLNSRLLTEIAYIQIQELKMQAIMNEQLSQQNTNDINAQTQAAKLNQP